MRIQRVLVPVSVIVGHLLAGPDVPGRDQNQMRPAVNLKQLSLTISVQLRMIQQPAQTSRLGRRVNTIPHRLVLEKVHVAADARVPHVVLLAFLGRLVADHFAVVLADEIAAAKVLACEDRAALALHGPHLESVLASGQNGVLNPCPLLLLDIGFTLARALTNLKVVGDLAVAATSGTVDGEC